MAEENLNCPVCGAPPFFKVGDRVQLNDEWGRWTFSFDMKENYPVGRKGTIAPNRTSIIPQGCTRVKFDGERLSKIFHQTFLTKI